MHRVFVYGTLKRGFANHPLLEGSARFLGPYRTTTRYLLVVAGTWCSPVLVDRAGAGHRVLGELYEVDDRTLGELDRLERVHAPDGYRRAEIVVEGVDPPHPRTRALAYLKDPARVTGVHGPPLASYEDTRYVPRHARRREEP